MNEIPIKRDEDGNLYADIGILPQSAISPQRDDSGFSQLVAPVVGQLKFAHKDSPAENDYWLLCDGSEVSILDYPMLGAILGTVEAKPLNPIIGAVHNKDAVPGHDFISPVSAIRQAPIFGMTLEWHYNMNLFSCPVAGVYHNKYDAYVSITFPDLALVGAIGFKFTAPRRSDPSRNGYYAIMEVKGHDQYGKYIGLGTIYSLGLYGNPGTNANTALKQDQWFWMSVDPPQVMRKVYFYNTGDRAFDVSYACRAVPHGKGMIQLPDLRAPEPLGNNYKVLICAK